MHRDIGAGIAQYLALGIDEFDRRAQFLTRIGANRIVHNLDRGQAGHIVDAVLYRNRFDKIGKLDLSGHLGDDRVHMRIPGRKRLASGYLGSVSRRKFRTVWNLVALLFTSGDVIDNAYFAGPRDRDKALARVLDHLDVMKAHGTAVPDLDTVYRCRTAGSTTDMKGTHGQLGSRFANRLRGNNTYSLAFTDLVAAGQFTSVTLNADTVAGFAGDCRTNRQLVDTDFIDQLYFTFFQQGSLFNDGFTTVVFQVLLQHAAQYPFTEIDDNVATLDNRAQQNPFIGSTVIHVDNQVLGYVDQAPRQVTRVGGFKGGIRESLARAMGGDKVLQHVQSFAEVRGNRVLDNRSVRLGHQTSHTGQLANLRCRTARARVGHDENRVKRILHDLVALGINHGFLADFIHHRARHLVVGMRPDINHLVVTLARGNQAGRPLLFDILDLYFRGLDQLDLVFRHDHVVDAD